jgi:demethylmenaquinone methyltransferase/2-methoxy-6-polyprenyl-1,4-benzoquinol methylase
MAHSKDHISIDKKGVHAMFDKISSSYDLVNKVMTGYRDIAWRKQLARMLPRRADMQVLDVATGTADQILALFKESSSIAFATGIDLARQMLKIGQDKIDSAGLTSKVHLQEASALAIPYPEHSFDAATISFGIRNVTDPMACLLEMHRVLKVGGRVLILESSLPTSPYIRPFHLAYLRFVLPCVGGLLSREKKAYIYLNKTIESFPSGPLFSAMMEKAGFSHVIRHPMMFGAVTVYQGDKE